MRTGYTTLPLHWGKAPKWLFSRMVKLAREITIAIVTEYGSKEMLLRLSDPYWFQAFGCVLGYDWHSSGLTTVTCGAIKEGIKGIEKDLGFFAAGGKGRTSRKTPQEIDSWAEKINIKVNPENLKYASRMSAKVDSTAIQDGYQIYHHNFFFTTNGHWTVVQQGLPSDLKMKKRKSSLKLSLSDQRIAQSYPLFKKLPLSHHKPQKAGSAIGSPLYPTFNSIGYARRYHWTSQKVKDFVNEPQSNICDNTKYQDVLNLTSIESTDAREVIYQISKEKPEKHLKEYSKIISYQMPKREWIEWSDIKPENLKKVLISTYENQPQNFEELLGIKGVGPKSIRALTLISELTYGTKADWNDPVKYSFAHGGKDGYPYPVDRETYDKSIEFLKKAIRKSKLQRSDKNNCLLRLFNNS